MPGQGTRVAENCLSVTGTGPSRVQGVRLDCGYRIDVLIEDVLILELKAIEEIKGIHEAQLLSYMKLARIQTGLLINFNAEVLKNGIRRFKL
jgi:GxxExxY protein